MSLYRENIQEQEQDTQQGRYLTFNVAEETYGIDIMYVIEIVGLHPITALPEMPSHIKGVINLRGRIFPVIEMRARFHKPVITYTDRTCIIVVDIKGVVAGMIVDRVDEVISIEEENIQKPPDSTVGIENKYLKGIGKVNGEIKLLLDCQKLLRDDEVQGLQKINLKEEKDNV
jgi:purine-binding chemotaxis protein CheW